ncbi:MAG: beta-propeller fold lactonase family protein [Chloroflexota bacterium]
MKVLAKFFGIAAIMMMALVGAGAASANHDTNKVVGHVYTNENTAGANTVAGFDRHADGTLTPIAGSPFNVEGAGTGTIVGSAGAIAESDDGHFLLAVDAGSNQISVARIAHDGSLSPVFGGPVSANGTTPVSIAVHNHLVYVANTGAGGSNYTGFYFLFGHLFPIPGSTYALPDDALPGTVIFNGNGNHLIGTRVGPNAGPSFIDSFDVRWNGQLVPAPGSPFAAQKIGPFGSSFSPTHPNQLFVSNAHDGALAGSVSAYNVSHDGTLTPIGASPFADNQTAPCWVALTHDGKYLFAVNTASSSISSYKVSQGGTLTLLGSTPFKSPTGLKPFDIQVAPGDHFLYVVDAGAAKISAFAVANNGGLSELASSPISLPAGATPFGIVVD